MNKQFAGKSPINLRRQSGAVLFVGLIVLLVLVMLGVTHTQSAVIQERLAGNYRDMKLAFESTEAGGRWGAAWLQSLGGDTLARPWACESSCDSTFPVWVVGQYPSNPHPKDSLWASAKSYGVDPGNGQVLPHEVPLVSAQPKYIMEEQFFRVDDLSGDPQKGVAYYRVTAMGVGHRTGSDAVLASVMAKRFE